MTDIDKAKWVVEHIAPARLEKDYGLSKGTVYDLKRGGRAWESRSYSVIASLVKVYDDAMAHRNTYSGGQHYIAMQDIAAMVYDAGGEVTSMLSPGDIFAVKGVSEDGQRAMLWVDRDMRHDEWVIAYTDLIKAMPLEDKQYRAIQLVNRIGSLRVGVI